MNNEELHAILYVSSATQAFGDPELSSLYAVASKRNLDQGVTGVLLFSNGNFIQYLEGPKGALSQIYGSIKEDTRHTGLIEIMNEPIDEREFPQWSLASKTEFFQTLSNPEQYSNLLQPYGENIVMKHSVVRDVLHSFWNQARISKR
jgi:hypothetical protein